MQNLLQLTNTEKQMIEEVFQVFGKYADTTRTFGVNLVHSHFLVSKEEILYEIHDRENRILTTTPVKKDGINNALATSWERNEKGEMVVTKLCCDQGPPVEAPTK